MMDINKMFMNKNYEILKKKLDLDINNNADSLNHTVSNFIDLKAIGLNKYICETYDDSNKFNKMSLVNISEAGRFASDRSIEDYAKKIWNLKKVK